jgi:hypothetical protein
VRQRGNNVQLYVSLVCLATTCASGAGRRCFPARREQSYQRTCTATANTSFSYWPDGFRTISMQTAKTRARCRISGNTPETCCLTSELD